jgi:hypothetical protein
VNIRSLFSAGAILGGLALSSSSAAIAGDRCQVPSSDLLGLRGVDGKCVGVRRDIAARFLRIERSECAPAPTGGVKIFGRCIADDPKQAEDEAYMLADRALGEADGVFKNEMAEIRAEVDRQLADLSSKIEELRGKLRNRRPDREPDRENETLGL